jgi:hypothetical protein
LSLALFSRETDSLAATCIILMALESGSLDMTEQKITESTRMIVWAGS